LPVCGDLDEADWHVVVGKKFSPLSQIMRDDRGWAVRGWAVRWSLNNPGRYSSASRPFGPLQRWRGLCIRLAAHWHWLRAFSILEAETPRRNRQGVGPCFRSSGNSVLLRERLVRMHRGRISGEDSSPAWLSGQSSCSTSHHYFCFPAQEGRAPVQAGSASHSDRRIRRSSLPTLTKTKGASSWPVFEPTKIAGIP